MHHGIAYIFNVGCTFRIGNLFENPFQQTSI